MSDGCADAQKSLAKIACSRCSPSRAWQRSPPCRRHGYFSRQYQQRVDWSRLPPTELMLRSCGEAASRHASRSAAGIVRIHLELGQRRAGADAAAVDAARDDPAHVDERVAVQDPVAQQRHHLRAAVHRDAAVELLDRRRPNELQPSPSLPLAPAARPRAARAASPRGVIGSSCTSAPVASRIAFAIAAAVGTIGGSPRPFEPRLVRCSSGLSTNSHTISGTSAIVGIRYESSVVVSTRPVSGSSRRSSESVWPIPWMIPPSTWLARAERVDDPADVVHRGDPLHAHLAGLDVDGDLGHLHAEREHAHPGRVRAARALAEDLRASEHAEQLLERDGEIAVRGDDRPVADVEHALLEVVALRRDLDDLALRVGGGGTHGRADRRQASTSRPRASRTGRGRSRRARPRRGRAGRRAPRRRSAPSRCRVPVPMSCIAVTTAIAAVGADARPRVRRRAAAAEPDLARHPDAVLPRSVGARAHLVPAVPVLLRELVARREVLRGVRRAVVRVRVVASPQLERVEVELRGELVDQALEPERPLDEAGRAERLHRRRVDLRAVADGAHVVARVEHLHRPVGHRRPAAPADRVDELAAERDDRAVAARADDELLDRRVAVAGGGVLLAPGQRAAHRPARAASRARRRRTCTRLRRSSSRSRRP